LLKRLRQLLLISVVAVAPAYAGVQWCTSTEIGDDAAHREDLDAARPRALVELARRE